MADKDSYELKKLISILCKLQIGMILQSGSISDKERSIYSLTGIFNQTQIKEKLKVSPNTISSFWKRGRDLGILIKDGQGYKKVVDEIDSLVE